MSVFNPLTSEYASQVLSEVGKELCLKTDMADVHFIFNLDDESIEHVPAHKLILKAGSDVFRTMFNGTWKEKDEVEIVDVSADVFKEFLQFFYLNHVKLTIENVTKVMNLGNMYNVTGCLTVCSEFMKNNLNNDNVCLFYGSAILYNQQDLKKACEIVIGLNTNAVLKSSGFLTLDKRVLAEILKSNWLSCTEVELFEACISWSKIAGKQDSLANELENLQAQLADSFYDIRFELMSLQELAPFFLSYGDLLTHNMANIMQKVVDNESKSDGLSGKQAKRALFPWNDTDLIECNRLLSAKVSCSGRLVENLEITKFSSNKPLIFKKIELSRIFNYQDSKIENLKDMPTEITIVEVSDSRFETSDTGEFRASKKSKIEVTLYNGKSKFRSSKSETIVLSVPILIRPGFMYEIRFMQTPPDNCKVGGLLKTEVQMKDGITIQFHDDPLKKNDFVPRGMIYSLYFYPTGK